MPVRPFLVVAPDWTVRVVSIAQAAAWPGVGKVVLSVPSSATMTWAASAPMPVSSSSRSITDSTGAPACGQHGAWPPPISPQLAHAGVMPGTRAS